MPETGTFGLMSGERKRSVAVWPKLPRLSSTLPRPDMVLHRSETSQRADFVAEVGDGKNEATVSMSLSRLLRPLHLAVGPLRQ